jgi:hypothetical protein
MRSTQASIEARVFADNRRDLPANASGGFAALARARPAQATEFAFVAR